MGNRSALPLALLTILSLTTLARSDNVPTLPVSLKPKNPKSPKAVVKTLFTASDDIPSGWKRYRSAKLNPSTVSFQSTSDKTIPPEFRSFAKRRKGFSYEQKVKPGTYRVQLGFIELQANACARGARVFSVTLNGKSTSNIDVFDAVGCRKAHTVAVDDVVVASDSKLLISLKRVKGTTFLSNFQVLKVRTRTPKPSKNPRPESSNILVLNAGGSTDRADDVVGSSRVYAKVNSISGTDQDALYSVHRYGKDFRYVLGVKPKTTYNIELLFAESYEPGCKKGFRVFDVTAYDEKKTYSSGKSILGLDVFRTAGCRTALSRSIEGVSVGKSGLLAIKLKSQVENAMISGIIVSSNDPEEPITTMRPTTTVATTKSTSPKKSRREVNVGGPDDIDVPGTSKSSTGLAITSSENIDASILRTARFGSDFTFSFKLEVGSYDVLLGFSENDPKFCSKDGKRVFNVYINNLIQREAVDIFAQVGCRTGLEISLPSQTVGGPGQEGKLLTIRFESVASFAQVNYIKIAPAVCVPESTSGVFTDSHGAHAVPGSYPPQLNGKSEKSYVDSDGNGFYTVKIDGGRSHTHYSDSANNIVGRITSYTWMNVETGKVISTKESFTYDFPLGTTRLKLKVVDNVCTMHMAETTVTVTGARQPGQYCYYYAGLTELPVAGDASTEQYPEYASISPNTALGFPKFSFDSTKFAVRCVFFLEVDKDSEASKISVVTGKTGIAKVYKGGSLILDSVSKSKVKTSLAVGLTSFEVVYLRSSLSKKPKLTFLVNDTIPANSKIFHDRSTVRPILTSLSPAKGNTKGGTQVTVTGYGLFFPFKVKFGSKNDVKVESFGRSSTKFIVKAPAVSKPSTVPVSIISGVGSTSNSLSYAYGGGCDDVSFSRDEVLQKNGDDVDYLGITTCSVIGQDGKIYLGTLGGTVQVLGYDSVSLTATSHCYSTAIKDPKFSKNGIPAIRDILGITFDPSDKDIRPYVSTSTFQWYKKGRIDESNKKAWQNGAVDRLKVGTDPTDRDVCLVYDKRIVSHIPVSNHDHSVNALLFTQDGDLLVSVGSFTNAGLPGYKSGGYWETAFSAAILIAKLSKPGFDGDIQYDKPETPRLAKKVSGDVDLYATGVRNSFAMTMNTKGHIYATDNGPNCGFGNVALSCSEYDEKKAAKWDPKAEKDWPGQVKKGWIACPYSIKRQDKVLYIEKGGWYGHPNLNRGGDECAWIDPDNDRNGDNKPAPSGYHKAMTMVTSAATGINEYQANHFCGKLRGNLIISSFKNKPTYRMGVDKGSVTREPEQISPNGGIGFVVNARGDLIFPQYQNQNLFVLRPDVSPQATLFIAGAVPFRHGKKGGTLINIGGNNFGVMPAVKIGSKKCTVTRSSDTEITCKVPPNSGGPKSLSVTSASGESDTLPDAVLYMSA